MYVSEKMSQVENIISTYIFELIVVNRNAMFTIEKQKAVFTISWINVAYTGLPTKDETVTEKTLKM